MRAFLAFFVVFLPLVTGIPEATAGYQQSPFTIVQPGHDYGVSAMRDGSKDRFWWCGVDTSTGVVREVIWYKHFDFNTNQWSTPFIALPPEPANWDKYLVCDPSVVKGTFLYDGQTWSYAMYYTANIDPCCNGVNNAIGVAFSNDLVRWIRQPPIINAEVADSRGRCPVNPVNPEGKCYGAGQQSAVRINGTTAGVRLFFRDNSSGTEKEYIATSSNGYTFGPRTLVPTSGLNGTVAVGGDVAHSPTDGYYYTAFPELNAGQYGRSGSAVTLARIPAASVEAGTGSWTLLGQINTDVTLSRYNDNPGNCSGR